MTVRKVLLTGAAGRVGSSLRARLCGRFDLLRVSDIATLDAPGPGEETVQCDLTDYNAVKDMCRGMDAVVHLGAEARETSWPRLTAGNITGVVNIYEGARKAGVDRVLFASSITTVGFYRVNARIDHTTPPRPDGRYSLTKAFGENLARLSAYKHAIRGFVMRLGACRPKPTETSLLPIWLSYDDMARLVMVGLSADYRFEIVYGLSRSSRSSFDNSNAHRLGYEPLDNADDYEGVVEESPPPSGVAAAFHGPFASTLFSGNIDWPP